jgi:hypothetical protein
MPGVIESRERIDWAQAQQMTPPTHPKHYVTLEYLRSRRAAVTLEHDSGNVYTIEHNLGTMDLNISAYVSNNDGTQTLVLVGATLINDNTAEIHADFPPDRKLRVVFRA